MTRMLPTPPADTGRAILNACRLDFHRIRGGGSNLWLMLGFAPVFTLVVALVSGNGDMRPLADFSSGAVNGSCFALFIVMAMYVFFYESEGRNEWMNGLIPVNRTHQVLGRYATMIACALTFLIEEIACILILNAFATAATGAVALWSGDDTAAVFAAVVVFILLESVAYPLLYRFPAQKAVTVMLVVMVVLVVAALALAVTLPQSVLDDVERAVTALSEHTVTAATVGGVVTVAVLVISVLCSLRVYRAKEL